ncbi:unnamed protein product [Prunus brigantina]
MQKNLFNKIMHDICNYDEYFVQKRNCALVFWDRFPNKSSHLLYECWRMVHLLIKWMRLAGWGSPLLWRVWLDFVMQSKLSTPGLPAPTYAQRPATTSTESRTERISRHDWFH